MRKVSDHHLEAAQNGSRQVSTVRGTRSRVASPPLWWGLWWGSGAFNAKRTSRQEKMIPLKTSCGPSCERNSPESAWVLVPAQKGPHLYSMSQGQ